MPRDGFLVVLLKNRLLNSFIATHWYFTEWVILKHLRVTNYPAQFYQFLCLNIIDQLIFNASKAAFKSTITSIGPKLPPCGTPKNRLLAQQFTEWVIRKHLRGTNYPAEFCQFLCLNRWQRHEASSNSEGVSAENTKPPLERNLSVSFVN